MDTAFIGKTDLSRWCRDGYVPFAFFAAETDSLLVVNGYSR